MLEIQRIYKQCDNADPDLQDWDELFDQLMAEAGYVYVGGACVYRDATYGHLPHCGYERQDQ